MGRLQLLLLLLVCFVAVPVAEIFRVRSVHGAPPTERHLLGHRAALGVRTADGAEIAPNSLEAIRVARDLGIGVELDVMLDANGVPRLAHDAHELADAPQLSEGLALLGPDMPLYLDLKVEENGEAFADALADARLPKTTWIEVPTAEASRAIAAVPSLAGATRLLSWPAFDPEDVGERGLLKTVLFALATEMRWIDPVERMREADADGIVYIATSISDAVAERVHAAGGQVAVFFVAEPAEHAALVKDACGGPADVLILDYADRLGCE